MCTKLYLLVCTPHSPAYASPHWDHTTSHSTVCVCVSINVYAHDIMDTYVRIQIKSEACISPKWLILIHNGHQNLKLNQYRSTYSVYTYVMYMHAQLLSEIIKPKLWFFSLLLSYYKHARQIKRETIANAWHHLPLLHLVHPSLGQEGTMIMKI